MILYVALIIILLVPAVIILDILKKIHLTKKKPMFLLVFLIPHTFLFIQLVMFISVKYYLSDGIKNILLTEIIILFIYLWMKFNIRPYSTKEINTFRLRILLGGRRLLLFSLYASFVHVLLYYILWHQKFIVLLPTFILTADIILTSICLITLYINGLIRVLITSRRLSVFKRTFVILFFYIPIINLFIIFYLSHKVQTEYDHESYKINLNKIRVDSSICKTNYPLVMLHGVGFRDLKYLNYWGRIPKELIRNGATVYYGHQEAWGTIEDNAEYVKEKILQIVHTTGCKKVNIIAHSKGGLDARYMISQLNMADYVASLTMISTPHHGSELMDFIYYFPNGFITFIGKQIDRYFRLIGDKNPNFSVVSKQFLTRSTKAFNQKVLDKDGVYYQSYASVMRYFFSDYILTLPYIIMKIMSGESDGLVTIESSKWGEFKGVLRSSHRRGISHGDIIDLRRDDYRGFDIREHYVKIVEDLKNKGF